MLKEQNKQKIEQVKRATFVKIDGYHRYHLSKIIESRALSYETQRKLSEFFLVDEMFRITYSMSFNIGLLLRKRDWKYEI